MRTITLLTLLGFLIEQAHTSVFVKESVKEDEIPLLGQPGLRHRKITSKMLEEEKSYIKAHRLEEDKVWVQEEEQDGPLVLTQQGTSTPPHIEKDQDALRFEELQQKFFAWLSMRKRSTDIDRIAKKLGPFRMDKISFETFAKSKFGIYKKDYIDYLLLYIEKYHSDMPTIE